MEYIRDPPEGTQRAGARTMRTRLRRAGESPWVPYMGRCAARTAPSFFVFCYLCFVFFLFPWVSYFTSLLYTQCLFSRLQGESPRGFKLTFGVSR